MQLYLIRHGQSTNNARWDSPEGGLYSRTSDPTLTEKGQRQAEALAEFLTFSKPGEEGYWRDAQNRLGFGITHLYCSLMQRAIHTATIISSRLGLPLYSLLEAHEVGGVFVETVINDVIEISQEYGVTPEFLTRHYPDLLLSKPISENGWWRGGREDDSLPLKRAQEVLNYLKERHYGSEDRVALVTHGGFYNYLVRAMLQIAPHEPDNRKLNFRLIYNNCALSRFDFVGDRIWMVYHNRTDFLPDELVTS